MTEDISPSGDQGFGAEVTDGTNSGNTAPQSAEVLLQVVNEQSSIGSGAASSALSSTESMATSGAGAKKSRFTVKAVPPPAPSNAPNGTVTNGIASSDPSAQLILLKLEHIIEMNSALMCRVLNNNSTSNQSSGSGTHNTHAPSSSSAEHKNGAVVISPSVSSSNVRAGDIVNGVNGSIMSSSSNGNGSNSNLASIENTESKPVMSATAESNSSSSTAEKEKIGLGRLTHYLNEMKKELEVAQKQRKDTQLETQRLREKCQQLEDKLSMEQTKGAAQDDKVAKLKDQSKAQRVLIEQLQQQLAFYQSGSSSA